MGGVRPPASAPSGASGPYLHEFMYGYASGSQSFDNVAPPYAEESKIRITSVDSFDFDAVHPHIVWHADTHEVEFTADGLAWVQAETLWTAQPTGGVQLLVTGPTYQLSDGSGPANLSLYLASGPLSIETGVTGDHTSHTGGLVILSGTSGQLAVEAGDRWAVAAKVGSTTGATMPYADIGAYWTNAGY